MLAAWPLAGGTAWVRLSGAPENPWFRDGNVRGASLEAGAEGGVVACAKGPYVT
jgi:hypothetical protein